MSSNYTIQITQRYKPQAIPTDQVSDAFFRTDAIFQCGNLTTAVPVSFSKFSDHIVLTSNAYPLSIINGIFTAPGQTVVSSNATALVLSGNMSALVGASNDRAVRVAGTYYKVINYATAGNIANIIGGVSGLGGNLVHVSQPAAAQSAVNLCFYGHLGNGAIGYQTLAGQVTASSGVGNIISSFGPVPNQFFPVANATIRIPIVLERNGFSNVGNVLGQLYYTEDNGPRFVIQPATGTLPNPVFASNAQINVHDNNFSYIR